MSNVYGEEHRKEFCRATSECCSNCGGAHRANSKICSLIAEAYEIEKHTAYNQQTHNEARQFLMDQKSRNSRNYSTTHVIQADVHHALHSQVPKPRTAYSDIVKRTTILHSKIQILLEICQRKLMTLINPLSFLVETFLINSNIV